MAGSYTIVVGYDGSESARRALDRAAELTTYGSRLVLAHVAAGPGDEARSAALLDQAEQRLVLRRVFCERRGLVGRPAAELIRLAEQVDADFIVVGNGKTALQRLLLGSVSAELVHRAPCDVLVVR